MESADYSIYNGKQIKVESISTVNDLHRYLNKTVSSWIYLMYLIK